MVYFDETKIAELAHKFKSSRPNVSIRMLVEEIALMEAELRILAESSPSPSP